VIAADWHVATAVPDAAVKVVELVVGHVLVVVLNAPGVVEPKLLAAAVAA